MKKPFDFEFYDFDMKADDAAESCGCVVVYPERNQLQIDIDSDDSFSYFNKRMGEIQERAGWKANISVQPSKSGLPHRHITVTFENKVFEEWQRIALQTMLGSDPVREGLNAMRYECGCDRPTRLFRPKS